MAKTQQIAAVFQAIAEHDWTRAQAESRALVEAEERRGHHFAAQQLRGALQPNGHRPSAAAAPEPYTAIDLTRAALTQVASKVSLADVVLTKDSRTEVEELCREWRGRAKLAKRGIRRRSKILFYGPPGCGKSFAAKALAGELGLALYVVRFDAIVGAYLGQTAIRLRQLFQFAEATPCVLLIDEVDALGKRRGRPTEVGELDRIVISLLQELEHSDPMGLLIAASNLPTHLDEALWRRFDLTVRFPRPTKTQLRAFAVDRALRRNIAFDGRLKARVRNARNFVTSASTGPFKNRAHRPRLTLAGDGREIPRAPSRGWRDDGVTSLLNRSKEQVT